MADVELLPCSVEHELRVDAAIIRNGIDGVHGPINREALADRLDRYAHAAAAQETEIKALRAEVERLRADRDSWEQQASDRVADWHAEHLRADKLAKALAELITWIPSADTYRRLGFDPEAPMRALGEARAALSKEEGK
nr:MAG: hypothetical protein DIU74_13100 [Pseudomonadota bacterium]